jgi:hypothetical protein
MKYIFCINIVCAVKYVRKSVPIFTVLCSFADQPILLHFNCLSMILKIIECMFPT